MYHFLILLFFIISILSSCSIKRLSKESLSVNSTVGAKHIVHPNNVVLYIEMPKNMLVFENVSSIIYEFLWNHFNRVGYKLVNKNHNCFTLKILVKNIDSSKKFLSPDLLTYSVRMKVDLFCQLFDKNDLLITQKTFIFSTLIPRSKEYVENSKISDFEYKKLFGSQISKVDQYFRKFFKNIHLKS